MAGRKNAPAQDITPFVVAGGVAGIGVAQWYGYPGLPVLWLSLVVAAWMVQPPALTGKKDSYGYPTPANSAEERKVTLYRLAKELQTSLILPVSDIFPGSPIRFAWVVSLWAALVGWLIPVIGTRAVDPMTGHLLNAIAAFITVAAISGAKRRSLGEDNPGVCFDSLPEAFKESRIELVVACVVGAALGTVVAGVATAVVVRYGSGFGATTLVTPAHHPGLAFVHPALVWLVLGLGGAGVGVWLPWSKTAMSEWRSLSDARAQWKTRWEALKYDPAPVLSAHKVISYLCQGGAAQVEVDTFAAPTNIGAAEFYKLEQKINPMVGSGMKTAILSCLDSDRGSLMPGTWSNVQFVVAAWPLASPPDITNLATCPNPEDAEELALLWIESGLAWSFRSLGGNVEPALISIEQIVGTEESDDLISELDEQDVGVPNRRKSLAVVLREFWAKVKLAPTGDGEGTLAAALADEESTSSEQLDREVEQLPAVWSTSWQFPSNFNAKYLRDNGLSDVSENLKAPVLIDHRNDVIYVGYNEDTDDIDSATKSALDALASEDIWHQRWVNTLKQGANIPRIQPKTALEAKLDNGSVVHRAAFVINQGNNVSEYMGVEANLASALNGAKFVAITGWHDPDQGGRPGDRHPQALCVYWSNDPVPLTPKWLVPTISPACRWVLNGIVNKEFKTAKMASPEVVSARALTQPEATSHTWEVGLRLYGGVTTSEVRSKGQKIAENLAVPWVRVTDAEDGCLLYFGERPTAGNLADQLDMDQVIFLDWEQAFLESNVRGSNGAVPQLIETSHLPANRAVSVLEFSLPPGLDIGTIRGAVPKLRTATGNAYIDVAPSEHGPTQIQVRTCVDNPLPTLVEFDFLAADRAAGYAFATGVDGEPVVFDPQVSPHVVVIGQAGSGKSVCIQGLAYCAATRGAEVHIVDPMKAAADFGFIEPYARTVAVTISDAAAVLRAVYADVKQRAQMNAQYSVGSYMDLPEGVRPVPIVVVVDEFTSLITSESPPRAPYDDPELEADRLQQIALRDEKRAIGTMIGKLAREARSAGVTLVLGTQKLMAKSLDDIPGGGDLKDLSLDTRIPVPISDRFPTGWALNKELQLGDLLYTPDGMTAPIIGFSDVFHHQTIYEVRFSDGRTVKTGPHHLWLVSDQKSRMVSSRPELASYQRAKRLDRADVADSFANTIPVGTWMSSADIAMLVEVHEVTVRTIAKKLNLPCMVEGSDGSLYPHVGTKPHGRDHHYFLVDKAAPILDIQIESFIVDTHGQWMTADELSVMVFGEQPKVSQIKLVRRQLMDAGCPYIDGRASVLYEATETFTAISKYWRGLSGVNVDTGYQTAPGKLMTTIEMMEAITKIPNVGLAVEVASPIVGEEVTLPCDPYTLGVWLGDGSLGSGNVTSSDAASCTDDVGLTDQEHLLNQLTAAGHEAHRMTCDEKLIGTYGLKVRLREAGVLHDKHIPPAYLRASFDQRLALLQGLMDTDGSVMWNGGCTLPQVNKRIAEGARGLIESLGIRCGWSEWDGRYTLPGSTEKKWTKRVYNLSFRTDLPCFRLPRKLAKQRPPNKSGVCRRRFIKAVTRIPGEPTRCISVDHPSHLFLVEGFVPTHNSNLARILLGVASPGERMSALRVFEQAPDLGTPVPKGRGIWESAVASGVIIQTWFAPQAVLKAELVNRIQPLTDEQKLDLTPFLRKTEQAPGVTDIQEDVDLGELKVSLEDLMDDSEVESSENLVDNDEAEPLTDPSAPKVIDMLPDDDDPFSVPPRTVPDIPEDDPFY
ncbi:MAG: FtsK/SpoIIIE domain-containing protein [Acidimicrobiales bacterium]